MSKSVYAAQRHVVALKDVDVVLSPAAVEAVLAAEVLEHRAVALVELHALPARERPAHVVPFDEGQPGARAAQQVEP